MPHDALRRLRELLRALRPDLDRGRLPRLHPPPSRQVPRLFLLSRPRPPHPQDHPREIKMKYTYATVCSGVEGCSLALNAAPPTRGAWEPVFFSEIAPFPSAVLAHRFPSVPNLGDMTQIKVTDEGITNGSATIPFHGRLDLLAGGTPCQDFSVAGRRAGGGTRKRHQKLPLLGVAPSRVRVGSSRRALGKCPGVSFHPQRSRLLPARGRAWRPRVWLFVESIGLPILPSGRLAHGHPAATAACVACRRG